MRCLFCEKEMEVRSENIPYLALPGTVLVGMRVFTCQECGEREVEIPAIEELNRVIAKKILQQTTKLDYRKIRFLRKYLGYSSVDLARVMGVAKETVSRWETDKAKMGAPTERLLRLMAERESPIDNYMETLARIEPITKPTMLFRLARNEAGCWSQLDRELSE